jgi:integrase
MMLSKLSSILKYLSCAGPEDVSQMSTTGWMVLVRGKTVVKSLNDTQIKKLLTAAEPYLSVKMRIVLALGTGLRRGDIESLKFSW